MFKSTIVVYNKEVFFAKLAALNKKAAKVGMAPITHGEFVFVKRPSNPNFEGWPEFGFEILIDEWWEVEIEADIISFPGGWQLAGIIDHKEGLRTAIPGIPFPAQYLDATDWCDHCKVVRGRNTTYIVQSATGEYKQVGQQCLAEFLGIDPERALAQIVLIDELTDMDEEAFGGARGESQLTLKGFLAYVVAAINKRGWISSSAAEEQGRQSTAAYAYFQAFERQKHLIEIEPTKQNALVAEEIVTWMQQIDPGSSDYMYSLRSIANNEYVTFKSKGYAASAYMAMMREREQTNASSPSSYLGEVGKKLKAVAKLEHSYGYRNAYGLSYIHKFTDAGGNVLVWSTATTLELGSTYTIEAAIKAHEEYRGVKQTVITRAKLSPQ